MPNSLAATRLATCASFHEGKREAQVCTYIFDLLEELKGGFECISLGEVALHFQWQNNIEATRSIQVALDYLSYGKHPILERKFILWPEFEEDMLGGDEIIFSDSEIRDALESGILFNPISGYEIVSFLDKINVIYYPTEYVKNIANSDKKGKL